MNRRRYLAIGVSVLVLMGVIFSLSPFLLSLSPGGVAKASLPRIDLSELPTGAFKFYEHPLYGIDSDVFYTSVLIYRRHDGRIMAWNVPTNNGTVGMPDLQWWRPYYKCKNFGPTVIDGVVDETKPIKCHDAQGIPEWWVDKWLWDINGHSLADGFPDMERTKSFIQGEDLVLGART